MSDYGNTPPGFGPGDFDAFAREAADHLRDAFGKLMQTPTGRAAWSAFDDPSAKHRHEPTTAGERGAGVWAICLVDDTGAHVEEVYATELDALRSNRHNTDPKRAVRFLPYGVTVSVLDDEPRDS